MGGTQQREILAERRKKIAENRKKKLFFSFIFCILIGAISLGTYVGFNFNSIGEKKSGLSKEKSIVAETVLPTLQNDLTVMILGVDERKDDVGRSDTLMILNLSDDNAALLTIPRDTRVAISGHGYEKINAAYAHGGEKLTKKTVEKFLGMDVDRYVKVNTAEFGKIIDAIGGIDIFIEKPMHYEDPWDDNGGLVINLEEGLRHLDGKTAIQFVRFRDSEGDAGRVRRQQAFMRACAERLSDPSIIVKLPEIFGVAIGAVETDLSTGEMLAVAGTLKNAEDKAQIKTGVVPGWWQYIGGVSYLVPNAERLGEVLNTNLGIETDKEHFERLSSEYLPGIESDAYDVNPNIKKDLKLMDYMERQKYDFSENDT